LNARPGERKAITIEAESAHERDVVAVAVVVVAGDVAGIGVGDLAGCVGEAVPDGFAFAIFIPCAFDLVRGSGGAPEEAGGERKVRSLRGARNGGNWIDERHGSSTEVG